MSKAHALNNHGHVVGMGGYGGSGFLWAACLWQDGRLSALSMPIKGLASVARDINDQGQIMGQAYQLIGNHSKADSDGDGLQALSVGPGGMRRGNKGSAPLLPFLMRDGRAEFFLHPDAGQVFLRAINNKGDIIGWSDTFHQDQPDHPPRRTRKSFLWSDGGLTDLMARDGGKFQAYALNDVGQIVGTADSPDGNHASHAWLWQNGRMTVLGTLGGYSIPYAINVAGQVVGVSATDDQEREDHNPVHGFLWENGTMINLDGISETQESRPLAINALGQIVGELDIEDGPIYGFLWQDGKMHDLNGLIDSTSGWHIAVAVDINDCGQIACEGEKGGGEEDSVVHGLLLTPL